MSILQLFILFLGGMTVLLISSQLLLSVSKVLAIRWKLSPLFVSLIIVALATNIPELTFTLSVFFGSDPGLAMGNIVGSNIANILLVFGLGVVVSAPRIGTIKTSKNVLLMLVITLLFMVVRSSGFSFVIQGMLLLGATALVMFYQYTMSVSGRLREDKYLMDIAKPKKGSKSLLNLPMMFIWGLMVATVVGIATGGYLVMSTIEGIAIATGISQTMLGLTLVAISTSMPELMTMLLAGVTHDDKVIVGTIIGSNIYNLGLFAGILLLQQDQTYISEWDLLALILSAFFFAFLLLFFAGKRIPRSIGVVMIGLFVIFVTGVFLFGLL